MGEKWQNLPFLGKTCVLVPVLKVSTSTNGQKQSGTGTHLQKGVGTGTNQSGTGIDASNSPNFCILVLLSLNSYSDSIGTLIND